MGLNDVSEGSLEGRGHLQAMLKDGRGQERIMTFKGKLNAFQQNMGK